MASFPVVSAKQLVKFFLGQGFRKNRQKGSHIILTKEGIARPLVIPNHKELDIGIVQNNLKIAGISKADFLSAMKRSKK